MPEFSTNRPDTLPGDGDIVAHNLANILEVANHTSPEALLWLGGFKNGEWVNPTAKTCVEWTSDPNKITDKMTEDSEKGVVADYGYMQTSTGSGEKEQVFYKLLRISNSD